MAIWVQKANLKVIQLDVRTLQLKPGHLPNYQKQFTIICSEYTKRCEYFFLHIINLEISSNVLKEVNKVKFSRSPL